MSNKEIRQFTQKLEAGLDLAYRRMLEEKALHNEDIVVSTMDGSIQYIPARQVLATL